MAGTDLEGYEVSVLFLIFVAITLTWELLLGVLTFLNNLVRGKRANWLDRVKEEVLALGVVSLVLLFIQPLLDTICKPDPSTAEDPVQDFSNIPGAYYVCPPGTRNVFPAAVIHAAHYLLFYLAVVHILFNMTTNSITSQRFASMVEMEREARNQDVAFELEIAEGKKAGDGSHKALINPLLIESDDEDQEGAGGPGDLGTEGASSGEPQEPRRRKGAGWWELPVMRHLAFLVQRLDQRSFSLLRKVCLNRFEAHAMDSNVRSFSYMNIASQVLEADLEQVFAHAWLMILFMTFLLLYPKEVYQIVWANVMCMMVLIIMSYKLNKVLTSSVQICKNVLKKGVAQQMHLRREEKLLVLAGEDGQSESGGSPSFTKSVSPDILIGRRESFTPWRPQDPTASGKSFSQPEPLQKRESFQPYRAGSGQLASHLLVASASGATLDGLAGGEGDASKRGGAVALTAASIEQLQIGLQQGPSQSQRLPQLQLQPLQLQQQASDQGGVQGASSPTGDWTIGSVPAAWQAPSGGPMSPPAEPSMQRLATLCAQRAANQVQASNLSSPFTSPYNAFIEPQLASSGSSMAMSGGMGMATAWGTQPAMAHSQDWGYRGRGQQQSWILTPPQPPMAPAPPMPPPPPHVELSAWQWQQGMGSVSSMAGMPLMTGHMEGGMGGSMTHQPMQQRQPMLMNGGIGGSMTQQSMQQPMLMGGGMNGSISQQSVQQLQPKLWQNQAFEMQGMQASQTDDWRVVGRQGSLAHVSRSMQPPRAGSGWPMQPQVASNPMQPQVAANPMHRMQQDDSELDRQFEELQKVLTGAHVGNQRQGRRVHLANQGPRSPDDADEDGPVFAPYPHAREQAEWGEPGGCPQPDSQGRPTRVDAVVTLRKPQARAEEAIEAKHARERSGRLRHAAKDKRIKAKLVVEEMHLPYHTMAELAEEVEVKIKGLFWFKHPHLMLWLVQIIFLVTSLSITTAVAFVIPYAKFQKLASLGHELVVWLPIMFVDVLMAIYLCWHVLPLYALITTAGTSFPPRVIEEIRAAKTLSHEEYHGISGMVLQGLNHVFVGVEEHDRKSELSLAQYFVTSLADHAGIVLSPHLRSHASEGAQKLMTNPAVKSVLREFAQFWHDLAWYGPPDNKYVLTSDMTFLHKAFEQLDDDCSGALSFGELAQMVRSLGALATAGDIETMLWEVDLDGSRSVGFDEFTKFLVYAFFDADANGYIGIDEIEDSMKRLGFRKASSEACQLLMSAADHNGDRRIGMREFFMLFENLLVEEDDDDEGDENKSKSSSKKDD